MGEEASQASFGVTLSWPPSTNHTVMVTNSDPGAVTVSPGSLTFTPTNWETPQNFIITPVQDADSTDEIVRLTLRGDELPSKTVTVEVRDDDRDLVLAPSAVTVTEEGGTAIFTVRLASLPGRDTFLTAASHRGLERFASHIPTATLIIYSLQYPISQIQGRGRFEQ